MPSFWARLSLNPWNILPDKLSLFTWEIWDMPDSQCWQQFTVGAFGLEDVTRPLERLETKVSHVSSQHVYGIKPNKTSRYQSLRNISYWPCSMYIVTHHCWELSILFRALLKEYYQKLQLGNLLNSTPFTSSCGRF